MAKRKVQKGEDYGTVFENLALLAEEKGIDKTVLADKIKYAIEKSLRSHFNLDDEEENVHVIIDFERNIFDVSIMKEVIEVEDTLYEPEIEIVLEEARKIDPSLEVGDKVRCPIDPHTFKRIAAKNAKDLIKQGFSNAERQHLSEIWGQYENEAVSATVSKVEPKSGYVILEINRNEVPLPRSEQIPGEVLEVGQVVKVYISGVSKDYKEGDKNQYLKVSRTDKWLIKRLFEIECPEIYDGTVEIKAVSRAPGSRSKIAVVSNDPNVDAVGACIGPQKSRINAVTKEIKGEKIDVVLYSDDPVEFIKQALKPAEVVEVIITDPNPDKRECKAIVPDSQLSLAIGNRGQNAWLAAKLTGYKIDIKAQSAVTAEDLKVVTTEKAEEPQQEGEVQQAAESAESADSAEE